MQKHIQRKKKYLPIKSRLDNPLAYASIHQWVDRHYGKASGCNFCGRSDDSKRYFWALKRGFLYDYKVENFVSLCQSCHVKYDMTSEWRKKNSLAKTGIKKSKDVWKKHVDGARKLSKPVEQVSRSGQVVKTWPSVRGAARAFGVNSSNIFHAISGRCKLSCGFKWRFFSGQ